MTSTTLRVPPSSIEVEQAILAAVLSNGESMEIAGELVNSEMFYRPENRIIFQACETITIDRPIDAVTVVEELSSSGLLDQAGGIDTISGIASNGRGTANLVHYCKILKDKSIERALLQASYKVGDQVYSDLSTSEKLHNAQAEIMAVGEEVDKSGLTYVNKILMKTIDEIDHRAGLGGGLVGLSTGFSDLDKKTSGFGKGNLIIVAGRPSMGKTMLAMNIAEHCAIKGESVLVFSTEMPKEDLMMRCISSVGGIDHDKVRKGNISDDEWPKFNDAVAKIKDSKLWIDDTPAITTSSMRSKARRYQRKHGKPDLIIVDYIQIMGDTGGKNANDTARITEISRNLKAMAKEFDCPLIAISQLNRGVEMRKNKRPMMSDLRDSGAIEQDADIILMMYRDEYYHENSALENIAECIIGKQRNGPTGTVHLTSQLHYVRFKSYIGQVPSGIKYTGSKQQNFLDD